MSAFSYRGSKPAQWVQPRPPMNACQRFRIYGPIQPMERPGLFGRLLGWR